MAWPPHASLRQPGYQGEVVFITYDQHALEAFAYRACDYLVKPWKKTACKKRWPGSRAA